MVITPGFRGVCTQEILGAWPCHVSASSRSFQKSLPSEVDREAVLVLQHGAGEEALPCCRLFIGPRNNAGLGQLDALQPEGDCQMVLVRKEQKKKKQNPIPNGKFLFYIIFWSVLCLALEFLSLILNWKGQLGNDIPSVHVCPRQLPGVGCEIPSAIQMWCFPGICCLQ